MVPVPIPVQAPVSYSVIKPSNRDKDHDPLFPAAPVPIPVQYLSHIVWLNNQTGTGTWTHCFPWCQSRSLYRPLSHIVWLNNQRGTGTWTHCFLLYQYHSLYHPSCYSMQCDIITNESIELSFNSAFFWANWVNLTKPLMHGSTWNWWLFEA